MLYTPALILYFYANRDLYYITHFSVVNPVIFT